ATERFLEFSEKWGTKYPAVIKMWSDAWAEMVRSGLDTAGRRVSAASCVTAVGEFVILTAVDPLADGHGI
ncbi:hypothetical protein ACIBEA_44395, partial [Streptomyces sp. NPDC051555]